MIEWIRRRPLVAYFGLAYFITWSALVPLAISTRSAHPLPAWWHALGSLGPIAAALIVSAVSGGRPAIHASLAGFKRWRIGMRWWLFAVSPLPLIVVSIVLVGAGGGSWPDFGILSSPRFANAAWVVDVLFVGTLAYGLGEEPGWRGFALPRLERRFGALVGTLVLVPVWALWHLPAFFYRPGYQGGLPTAIGFLFGLLAGAIVLTFLYDGSRGSLPAVITFHVLINIVFQVAGVVSEAAVAVANVIVALAATAIVVRWILQRRRARPINEMVITTA
jgi:membrane protease YdiL (CAAX protease family)